MRAAATNPNCLICVQDGFVLLDDSRVKHGMVTKLKTMVSDPSSEGHSRRLDSICRPTGDAPSCDLADPSWRNRDTLEAVLGALLAAPDAEAGDVDDDDAPDDVVWGTLGDKGGHNFVVLLMSQVKQDAERLVPPSSAPKHRGLGMASQEQLAYLSVLRSWLMTLPLDVLLAKVVHTEQSTNSARVNSFWLAIWKYLSHTTVAEFPAGFRRVINYSEYLATSFQDCLRLTLHCLWLILLWV